MSACFGRGVGGEYRSFQNESGFGLDKVKAEGLSAFPEAMEDTLSVALVVNSSGLFSVGCAIAEHTVDDDGELPGGGCDGLGFSYSSC